MSKKKNKKTIKHRPGTLERQEMKKKVRASAEWADLRHKLIEEQKVDPISLRPLTRTANCHHLSQNTDYYGDLSEDRFLMLNDYSHRLVHYLYDIVRRENGDYDVLERIKDVIKRMIEVTDYDGNR